MLSLKEKLDKKRAGIEGRSVSARTVFKNETGAIDLASIMVGIIVIGMIGGVVAATVFTVIPWSQDNAAKQQLDSIASAESAYMGLSSAVPSPLPAGYAANSFGNSAQLAAANLLTTGTTYCAVTPADGKSYTGYSKSASGKVWFMTDKNTKPQLLTDPVPAECGFTANGTAATPAPYVDPTPTITTLTYKCDTTISGTLPWRTNLTGTETWDDGSSPKTYTNATLNTSKTLNAGVTYKVTLDGTYKTFNTAGTSSNLAVCLISMDHWGANTGVTDASFAFTNSNKLTAVPAHIPSTITIMTNMFQNTTSFNQNINTWDVSNVTKMNAMFVGAKAFNQPLNDWDTSNVTTMSAMFQSASSFNEPLNEWDTSKVTDMGYMFNSATNFNQYIKSWDVSKVTSSTNFRNASALTAANSPF